MAAPPSPAHRGSRTTPGVLSGTPADQADKLRRLRDEHGVTYFVVQSAHAEAFGKVIAELR